MTGSPAVPTAAPSGRLAAVASVAAVGVVVLAVVAEVEVDEESLGVLPSDGVVGVERRGLRWRRSPSRLKLQSVELDASPVCERVELDQERRSVGVGRHGLPEHDQAAVVGGEVLAGVLRELCDLLSAGDLRPAAW